MALECKILIVKRLSGSILFVSTPSGADIHLGASGSVPTYTGLQTPNIISNLPIGDYNYIIRLSGYEENKGTITTVSGEIVPVITFLVFKHPLGPVVLMMPTILLIIDSLT